MIDGESTAFLTVKKDDLLLIEKYLKEGTHALAKSRIDIILHGTQHEHPPQDITSGGSAPIFAS